MKKYLISILIGVMALFSVCGCSQIKEWFSSSNFTTVASVISPSLQSAAKWTVYAVCKKNTDLNEIFKAAGNGLLIAVNSSDYSTEEIEIYIKQGLGKESETWWPLIETSMKTILSWYDAIYTKYFNIEDNNCLLGFNTILTAMANGIVEGASIGDSPDAAGLAKSSYVNIKSQEVKAVNDFKAKCDQFGIEIK